MLRVFQNFEWEVPISGDRDGGGGGGGEARRGKNDEIGDDLGADGAAAAQASQVSWPSIRFLLRFPTNILLSYRVTILLNLPLT